MEDEKIDTEFKEIRDETNMNTIQLYKNSTNKKLYQQNTVPRNKYIKYKLFTNHHLNYQLYFYKRKAKRLMKNCINPFCIYSTRINKQ